MLQAEPVAVGGKIIETVIVHADVRNVRGHALEGETLRFFRVAFFAGSIELEKGRAVVETFGPFGPTTGGVFAVYSEYG